MIALLCGLHLFSWVDSHANGRAICCISASSTNGNMVALSVVVFHFLFHLRVFFFP